MSSSENYNQPGPSTEIGRVKRKEFLPTGIAVLDIADRIGPRGKTYEEEYHKLVKYIRQTGDIIGPASPVIFANNARELYKKAKRTVADKAITPYNKCVILFQIFDALVLVFKNVSIVQCDTTKGVASVFGYSNLTLKTMLSHIEKMAKQVAVWVHDAHSMTMINNVMATTEQRLSRVRTEADMLEFFRSLSGSTTTPDSAVTATSVGRSQLPRGIESYTDSDPEVAVKLIERLYATNGGGNYIREFHDCMFLIATGNSQTTLHSALETRLADKDRNIVLLDAPGDRLFASSLCASAIGFLRKKLRDSANGDNIVRPSRGSSDIVETYRINYGRIFSKYRGESERNFDEMMEWIKKKVHASDKLRIFWFPDIENLMSPRNSSDQEHIAAIKNSMLQHMDVFNKDRTLRSFLLLFHSSEGQLDSAFSRRLETVIQTPHSPLTDRSVANEVVGAELARYHINLTDELANQVADKAGSAAEGREGEVQRVGGFAYIQATLRDMYVNQKLLLSHDVQVVETRELPPQTLNEVLGRYAADDSRDTLYDLNERPMTLDAVEMIAFVSTTSLGTRFAGISKPRKYNALVRGDPKDISGLDVARTLFLHDK